MTIAKYCKDKNMTKEEYKNFKNNIVETAKAIKSTLRDTMGVYQDSKNLFHWAANSDIKYFLIQELKKLNVEFIENYTLYRI